MKKILAILLSLTMVFSLSACASKGSTEEKSGASASTVKHTGKKISGQITAASPFSEGLAFVCLDGDEEKTYCINKDGYIVFELDMDLAVNGEINEKFVNGFVVLNSNSNTQKSVCDTKGKITTPEEVGVTDFCGLALEGGYLIVEKITSDYSSSKKEMGVMNTNFEWVVELSESIYEQIGGLTPIPMYTTSFFYNDICYFEDSKKYLNLKTGEVTDGIDMALPSNAWQRSGDNTYRDHNENVLLDLSDISNVTLSTTGTGFVNGKSPISFHNQESGTYFFTVINEKGEFLFEPIEQSKIGGFCFDGEYLIVFDETMSISNMKCYDLSGKLLGELNTETIEKNRLYSCEINDGVITVYSKYNFSAKCYYFNPDFTELF